MRGGVEVSGELIVLGLIVAVAALAFYLGRPKKIVVWEWEWALLYTDGQFVRILPPGSHRLWSLGRTHEVRRLSAIEQFLGFNPTDVITSDHFALRLSAVGAYRITDPRLAATTPYMQKLQTAASQALVALAAERTLEALLADRAKLGALLLERIGGVEPACSVSMTAITTLTLPPEVRKMLTEVERAKLEGLAALERARGEHAALRSLANAERLLKDNPDLMRLRTLQAVSPTGKGATLVLGADAMMTGSSAPR